MKKILFSILIFLFSSLFCFATKVSTNTEENLLCKNITGKVLNYDGKVKISHDNINWENVSLSTELKVEDWITTGVSSAVTFKFDDVIVTIGSISRVKVKKAVENEKNISVRLALENGRANIKLNTTHEEKNQLAVDSKSITAYAIGTEFTIDALDHVEVKEGVVNIYRLCDFNKHLDYFLSRNDGKAPIVELRQCRKNEGIPIDNSKKFPEKENEGPISQSVAIPVNSLSEEKNGKC